MFILLDYASIHYICLVFEFCLSLVNFYHIIENKYCIAKLWNILNSASNIEGGRSGRWKGAIWKYNFWKKMKTFWAISPFVIKFLNVIWCIYMRELIDWGLMPFSTIIQSYHGGQFAYSCVSWLSHTSNPHNNFSKQLATFPHRL